ncbi:TonB-dependent receptor domain-containing protein [Halocola ammonii]
MSRILFAIALLLFVSVNAIGQTTVSGTVKDQNSHEPIIGAAVLASTSNGAFTDEEGTFEIELSQGDYTLTIRALGFERKELKISVTEKDLELEVSLKPLVLNEAVVVGDNKSGFGLTKLSPVEGMAIYAGKKSEVIELEEITANVATNNSRQVYAKVAGLNIWESDGAGLQLGIGGRGLNPNRTSNFNTRQNGYDISADALGYPEAYYTPPVQALDRIEIVRGAASLQYGPQFGGMINFKMKRGPEDKKISVNSQQTLGSFGLFSSFNSVGGQVGKLNYYTYYHHKSGDGWRENSQFESNNLFGGFQYQVNEKLSLKLDLTKLNYIAQQPGGLTDTEFDRDPRQSKRERNWFKVDWNLAAFSLDYKLSPSTSINWRNFGLMASRDALGFLGLISRTDPLEERDLISGKFKNWGSELRVKHRYDFRGLPSTLLAGARLYNGTTTNRQGLANDGYGPDFYYISEDFLEGSDYTFENQNVALFAENVFNVTKRLSITPGLRFEYLNTGSDGYYTLTERDGAGNVLPGYPRQIFEENSKERSFALAGIGVAYDLKPTVELYGNVSQNYRAINFSDIHIQNPKQRVDKNISDERGMNADLGIRANVKGKFYIDASLFYLQYRDRIGLLLTSEDDPILGRQSIRLRTNISDARNIGAEIFAETDFINLFSKTERALRWTGFVNLALIDARYINSDDSSVRGKKVEFVPQVNLKAGSGIHYKSFDLVYQFSYIASQFTDATNASFKADPNAIVGEIPAYWVSDLSLKYNYKFFTLGAGVNNLFDQMYFTRRATGYPGPGIIPSDGRSFYITLGLKL